MRKAYSTKRIVCSTVPTSVINKFVIANDGALMQNLSCIDDMMSVPARERPASILWLPLARDTRVRVREYYYREFRE